MSGETVTYSLEAVLIRIEGKIDTLQKDINNRFDNLQKEVDDRFGKLDGRITKLEIGQTEMKGEINALDKSLIIEIKGSTARVAYQEFTNRGIFIPLVLAILGGAAKIFGFIGNL
jgi:hypothetical protein